MISEVDGTERLLFSPMELMEKLAALVPRPRAHITRYHGLFAPHSKNRHKIVLGKPKVEPEEKTSGCEGQEDPKSRSRMPWAKLLNRVFKIDITECQFCRGEVKIVAAILERNAIEKILTHLGLATAPPPIHPARPPPQSAFDDCDQTHDTNSYDF